MANCGKMEMPRRRHRLTDLMNNIGDIRSSSGQVDKTPNQAPIESRFIQKVPFIFPVFDIYLHRSINRRSALQTNQSDKILNILMLVHKKAMGSIMNFQS